MAVRWKIVKEAPQYEVGDNGEVRHRKFKRPRAKVFINGVAAVTVQVKDKKDKPKTKTLLLARLVGRNFVKGYRKDRWATLKNGDPSDCCAKNIVWMSRSDNAQLRKKKKETR